MFEIGEDSTRVGSAYHDDSPDDDTAEADRVGLLGQDSGHQAAAAVSQDV